MMRQKHKNPQTRHMMDEQDWRPTKGQRLTAKILKLSESVRPSNE